MATSKSATKKRVTQSAPDMKARLQRAQSQMGAFPGSGNVGASRVTGARISSKAKKLQRVLGGEIVRRSAGEYLLLKESYDADYLHGAVSFKSALSAEYRLGYFANVVEDRTLALSELLFFDTETTGLSGTGAVPFLIGFGCFIENGFETRQYIIPDLADEAAMLEDVFAEFGAERTLVSYNGKAFDKPLLQDRFILHRITRDTPYKEHIDLLHPTRALFKRRLGDCSLGNIEEHALGYSRNEDIPGYLVPSVYLDWLHNDEAGRLADVIAHNRQDIVSLAALMSVIAESFNSCGATLSSSLDAYSLMQVCDKRRKREMAVRIGTEREGEFARLDNPELEYRRSLIFKRAGDFASAAPIWERLTALPENREHVRRFAQLARLELAKWYEHHCRDYGQALALTTNGMRFSLKRQRPVDDWRKRKRRLERRLQRESIRKLRSL